MCITTHASASGAFRVLVVNRTYIGPSEYIGRKWGRDAASVLANPRSLHAGWERGEPSRTTGANCGLRWTAPWRSRTGTGAF